MEQNWVDDAPSPLFNFPLYLPLLPSPNSWQNKSLGLYRIISLHFRAPFPNRIHAQNSKPIRSARTVITVTKNEAPKSKPLFTPADSGDLPSPLQFQLRFNYVFRGEGDLFLDPFRESTSASHVYFQPINAPSISYRLLRLMTALPLPADF